VERTHEGKGPHKCHYCLRPCDAFDVSPWIQDSDDAELYSHSSHADHVNGATPKVAAIPVSLCRWTTVDSYLRHQGKPVDETGNKGKSIGAHTKGVGLISVESDLLEDWSMSALETDGDQFGLTIS
jgi:hypothetical protein